MAVIPHMSEPEDETVRSYPYLQVFPPEIRMNIFRYVLGIDDCRSESEYQAWVRGYQQTGNERGYLLTGVASESWLFNKTVPFSNRNSCISGSSPWKVKLDLHPAILNVSKQLFREGQAFIASENIFIKICTDIPDYDIDLGKFGLPVFTYHQRTLDEQRRFDIAQEFRTIFHVDMRTDQSKLLVNLEHFYLVPFKDIDQIIRALYLTKGREKAWFKFMVNMQHVPKHMKPKIEGHMADWMSSFRPVGSISITIPDQGVPNLDVTNSLTEPFDITSFVNAVKTLAGIEQSGEASVLVLSKADQKRQAVNQLSRLSALFSQNHPLLASSSPETAKFATALAGSPLYNLLQLEYAAAAAASTNNLSRWTQIVLPLSILLLSLANYFPTRRLRTLRIHLHTLTTLSLELRASRVLFDLQLLLRSHVLEQILLAYHAGVFGAVDSREAWDAKEATWKEVFELDKDTAMLIRGAKYTLETRLEKEGSLGEVWIMKRWKELCRDGLAMLERTAMIVGEEGTLSGEEEGEPIETTLEDVWMVQ
jgi:hypothetical protein